MIKFPPNIRIIILTAWLSGYFGVFTHAQEFLPLEVEKLGSSINSNAYDESAPVISLDGKTLFFTRTAHPEFDRTLILDGQDASKTMENDSYLIKLGDIFSMLSGQQVVNPITSDFNQDIWMAPTDPDQQINVYHPGYPVNNALPNSIVSTAKDTHTYLTINQFFKDGSMYEGFSKIYIENEQSSFPEPLHIYDFDIRQGDVNMTMSHDADILIISMHRYDTYGRNDLYVCFRVQESLYSSPKHMGSVINTIGQETTPFISRDKRRLYFSSDREGTIGGNDLFVAERQDYTWLRWSKPKSLGAPFNSTADDSQPYIDEVNNYMYFSSRRDGSSDIFKVSLTPIPKLEQPIVIQGKIVNRETGEIMPGEIFWGPGSAKGYLEFFRTNTGYFKVELTENEFYKFIPRKPNFRAQRINFDVRRAAENGIFNHEMTLYLTPKELVDSQYVAESFERSFPPKEDGEKIIENVVLPDSSPKKPVRKFLKEDDLVVGKRISFYNIYFLQSKAMILRKSEPALQELVSVLQEKPTMEILVGGHTDNVGDADKNMVLSTERAEAIKKYLVDGGIEPSRIKTKGFGPYVPITNNSTEKLREKNRRVEIQILKE
jgi:outer membrane protein OmpA-like peptidoglycan-associated protein